MKSLPHNRQAEKVALPKNGGLPREYGAVEGILSDDEPPDTQVSTSNENQMICPNCQFIIPSGCDFCLNCGVAVSKKMKKLH